VLETEPGVALNAVQFVARALLGLVQEAGRRVDAGVELDFPVSRQDIAEMTGTTLYTGDSCSPVAMPVQRLRATEIRLS
jgi:hypothetical protein